MPQSRRTNYRNLDDIGTGPYEAIVVSNLDPTYMGSLKVDVLKNNTSGSIPEKIGTSIEVRYLSPFYGVTSLDTATANDGYASTQKSYGMWFVPPDIGSRVLVIFAEGDISNGFWIGCVQDKFMNFMVPDGKASTELTTAATPDNLQGLKLPVGEYNKKVERGSGRDPTRYAKPYNKDFTQSLEIQGLIRDENRGTTTSSARREAPSSVFGISTPGPIDKRTGAPRGLQGEAGLKYSAFVNRLGGSSFVMDDGDDKLLRVSHASAGPPIYANVENGEFFGDKTLPHNELMRFRTRTGHQILMHNSEDFIYIANSRGTAWVELSSDGKIDVYGLDSISIHSDADINLTADRDVNIEGGRNVNVRASARYTGFESSGGSGNVQIESKFDTKMLAEQNMLVNVKGYQETKVTGYQKTLVEGDIHHHTNANLYVLADAQGHVRTVEDLHVNTDETLHLVGKVGKLTATEGLIDLNATADVNIDGANVYLNSDVATDGTAATDAEDAVDFMYLKTWTVPKTSPGSTISSDIPTFVKRMPSHEPYYHHENLDPIMVKSQRTDITNPVVLSVAEYRSSADTFRKSFSGGTSGATAGGAAGDGTRGGTNPNLDPNTSGVNSVTAGGTSGSDNLTPPQSFSSVGPDGNLLDMISRAEGAGYNTVFGGSRITPETFYGKSLTDLTVQEVIDWQTASVEAGSASSAAGRYQIIKRTLVYLVDELGVASRTDRFNAATQDAMARRLLQGRGLDRYVAGSLSESAFLKAIAQEWASLPVTQRTQGASRIVNPGESYYAGDGLNKSLISTTELVAAVRNARESGLA